MKRSGQDKSDKTQRNFRSIKAHGKPKKKENMKSNRFSKLIAAGVAGAFTLGTALAQDTSTTTSVTSGEHEHNGWRRDDYHLHAGLRLH